MSIPFSNINYRIPPGFANLLEGLTREVLREQPKDIPLFAAQYFEALLKNRKETGFDPAEWGAKLEDRFRSNHSFQDVEENIATPSTEGVRVISEHVPTVDSSVETREPQEALFSAQQSVDEEHKLAEEITAISQSESLAEQRESNDIPDSTEDHIQADVDHKEQDGLFQEQAASVIQAAFRGHLARQEVRRFQEEEAGDKSILPKPLPSHVTSEEGAVSHGEEQMKDCTGLDSNEHIEPHLNGSPEMSYGMMRNITDVPAASAGEEEFSPDTTQQENLHGMETEGIQEEAPVGKEENVDNAITKNEVEAGHDVAQSEDNDGKMVPETLEPQTLESPAFEETPDTHLQPNSQTQNPDLSQEQTEELEETLSKRTKQSVVEYTIDQTAETTGNPDALDTNEQDIGEHVIEHTIIHTNEATEHTVMGDSDEHISQTTGDYVIENSSDHAGEVTKQPILKLSDEQITKDMECDVIEDTSNQTTEATGQPIVEDNSDHTVEVSGQPGIEDASDHLTEMDKTNRTTSEQIIEANSDSLSVTTGDQITSDPIQEKESPGEENESCRKHQEEALDIALDDPGANAAATKIQAGFRGHMTRKKMKGSDKDLKHKDSKDGAEGSS